MQLKDFYIPEIEGASELLDLLVSSPKLKERMELLVSYQDEINKRLKRWEEFATVQQLQDAAAARIHNAKVVVEEADAYAKATKEAADKHQAEIEQQAAQATINQNAVDNVLDERAKDLQRKEQELVRREQSVSDTATEAKANLALANERLREAEKLRADYEAKAAKLSAVLGQ